MTGQTFVWASLIALACGLVAGLGALHSAKRTFHLGFTFWLAQMAAWMAYLTTVGVESHDVSATWDVDFCTGFFLSLVVALPFTVIGAVLGGTVVGVLRRRPRRR
jgi:hypothetical protein